MKMISVKAENILSVGYDLKDYNLHIIFVSGKENIFFHVPMNVYMELIHADNIDDYFADNVFMKYPRREL